MLHRGILTIRLHNEFTSLSDTFSISILIKGLTWASGGSAVKNPPATQETQVRSLDWEDLLEKEMATYSCLGNLMDGRTWWATV